MGQAKQAVYDIETAANVSLTWGIYDQNVPKVVQQSYVFGYSIKELGKPVRSVYIWDFPLYKKEPINDIEVIRQWIKDASHYDVLIGHNIKSFDNKVMMAGVMRHRLDPPIPFDSFDTKTAVKQVARFDSNKLDDLGERFGIGRKLHHEGIDLWWKCMNGDRPAQKKMVKYCEQDVKLTEKLYYYELPYARTHTHLNLFIGRPDACPRCGRQGTMVKCMKYRATNTNLYQYYRCKECGGMAKSRIAEPLEKTERMHYT